VPPLERVEEEAGEDHAGGQFELGVGEEHD
jgi:hypothetical protein